MAKTFAVFSSVCCLAAIVSFFGGACAYGIFCLVVGLVGGILGLVIREIATGNL